MILINQFPAKSYSLNELLADFRTEGLDMNICYFYSQSGALNVAVKVRESVHESLLCAWLISKGYMFTIERSDCGCFNRLLLYKRYVLNPRRTSPSTPAIPILCAGLMKTKGGKLIIHVLADAHGDQYAVALETKGDGVKEISYALGMETPVCEAPSGWIFHPLPSSSPVLSLPYISPGQGLALTSGYGIDQTVVEQDIEGVTIGDIYNDVLDRSLCLTEENLQSSTAVWGAPGYGKSTLISSMIYQMWKNIHIPFVVIEPKREYRSLLRLIPEMKVIRSLAGVNPLRPPKGMSYVDYVNVVLDLMDLISPLPGDSSLRDYFRDAYFHCVIKKKTYEISAYIQSYSEIMNGRYSGDAMNFVAAGLHKLSSFFLAFCGPDYRNAKRVIPFEKYMKTPMVIELGKVASNKIKSAYAFYIFQHIRASLRRESARKIDHVLVLEEAHMLLAPSCPIEIRRQVGDSLAEDRARGLTWIVTDQTPSRIDMSQVCLCGNVVSFRLLSESDRNEVAGQLCVSSEDLNNMQKREAFVRMNSMYAPAKVKVIAANEILSMTPLSDEECIALQEKSASEK